LIEFSPAATRSCPISSEWAEAGMKTPISVIAATFLLASPAARSPLPQNRPATTHTAVDAAVSGEMRAGRIPGAAIAVVENGAIVMQAAYGVADLEHDVPMTTSAVFEIASLTKPFTASAIMMLVEDGKVRLDDPVNAYLDRTPASWNGITIRHLLTHTSGMDISAMPRTDGIAPLRVTKSHAFDFIVQQPLRWPVGNVGWYSDAGYVLLGMVIEKASGQNYRDFITRRIFDPLAMHRSSLRDLARVLKGRVPVYSFRDGNHFNWRRVSEYEVPSAFGIYSTVQDLAAWDASLRQAKLLKPSSLDTCGRRRGSTTARWLACSTTSMVSDGSSASSAAIPPSVTAAPRARTSYG
jgi:D-alanyl-D-alanine carboxypeptidase